MLLKPPHTPLANRTQELDHFLQMAKGLIPQRIFLLQAPSGYGKTDLLQKFVESCPPGVYAVDVNLKSADVGIPYIFWRIKSTLGQNLFTNFEQVTRNFLSANINIADNKTIGQMDIKIALGNDEQTQKYRLMALQEAFFEDLQSIKQTTVILFDTYNDPKTEVCIWLGGAFLEIVANLANLRVVIAGQCLPERNLVWERHCSRCNLGEIREAQAWYKFTQEMGLNLSEDTVAAFVAACQGKPREIRDLFQSLLTQGWRT
jgi:hypothetical protein